MCTLKSMHVSTYLLIMPNLFCVHASADVTVLMMIMMMVFIYQPRWKKVDCGLNECSVSGCREPRASQEERRGRAGEEG